MVEALVAYDYEAIEPDELTLKKGDVITDIDIKPGGWWEGKLVRLGKRGMFPDNFVKVISNGDNKSNEVVLRKNSIIIGKCKVLFNYKPTKEDELELHVGDIIDILGEEEKGWWRGKLKDKVGVFPSNFVTELNETRYSNDTVQMSTISKSKTVSEINETNCDSLKKSVHTNSDDVKSATGTNDTARSPNCTLTKFISGDNNEDHIPALPPKPSKEMCRVSYKYEAVNDDELSLDVGDIITLISKEGQDVGWWKGELRGKIGVFPDNFVQVIQTEEIPKLDRSTKSNLSITNKVREALTKSASTTSCNISSLNRKISDSAKPEDKSSPPSISKKPVCPPPQGNKKSQALSTTPCPPPTHKKPQLSPSATADHSKDNILSKSPPTNLSKQFENTVSATTRTSHSLSSVKHSNQSENVTTVYTMIQKSDNTDGLGFSKQSYAVTSSVNITGNGVGNELDLDAVGKPTMTLKHPTASRVKAPRRRPPSAIISAKDDNKDDEETEKELVNGNAEVAEKSSTFVEELKLQQMKKLMGRKVRVMIGQSNESTITNEPSIVSAKTTIPGVTLRSQSTSGPRPVSMFSRSGSVTSTTPILSTTNNEEETVTITLKEWNGLLEKISKMESQLVDQNDLFNKSLKEIRSEVEEQKNRNMQIEKELEKLSTLVTQV